MNRERFEAEARYQATLAVARAMLRKGLITEDELTVIDTKMRQKYQPSLGTLFSAKTPDSLDFKAVSSD